jgi:hypothetical protein
MTVAILAANIRFVGLDFAAQWKGISAHRGADSMAHEPSGLVAASAEHPMDLQGAHPFLRVEHQEDNPKPFLQLDVGILEYGSRDDAESVGGAGHDLARALIQRFRATLAKVVERTRGQLKRLAAAPWALDETIRPALAFKKGFASVLVGEAFQQLAESHLSCRHIHVSKYKRFLDWCQVSDNPH